MKYNTILTIIQGMDTHYLNKNTCIHNWQNLSKLIFVLQISQVKIIIKIKETWRIFRYITISAIYMYYYFSNKIEGHLSGRSHISWMDSGAAFVWLNDVLHGKSAKRSFFAELCFTWKISGPAIFFLGGGAHQPFTKENQRQKKT